MSMTEGQRQAIENNMNSIVEGIRRVASDEGSDHREFIKTLARVDSIIWMEVQDHIPRSNKERLRL